MTCTSLQSSHPVPSSVLRAISAGALLLASTGFAADIKVACVGNSITYGYGLNSPYYESYPTQLDTLLGTGYEVSNFGVSGKTMIRASGDNYWSQSAFTSARAYAPDMVVIELGTNDSKDYIWPYYKQNFVADYIAMIDTFRILSSHPQVWTTLQPPAQNSSWAMFDTTIDRQVNPKILEAALRKAAPVIDLHTGMAGHPEWMQSDTVHPNAVGAKALAKFVFDMLKHAPVSITSDAGTLTATKGWGYQWYRNDTLLAGATAQKYTVTIPGSYKVSVRIDSASQSRLVSAAQSATTSSLAARSSQAFRVSVSSAKRLVVESAASVAPVSVRIWNLRGVPVPNERLEPGIYLYRIAGPDLAEQSDRIAVP